MFLLHCLRHFILNDLQLLATVALLAGSMRITCVCVRSGRGPPDHRQTRVKGQALLVLGDLIQLDLRQHARTRTDTHKPIQSRRLMTLGGGAG